MDDNTTRQIVQQALQKTQYNVSPVAYHLHTGSDSPAIPFKNLQGAPHAFCVATTTTGITSVPVFGVNGASFGLKITGVFLISMDATAANVTVSNGATTVTTIAKGTIAGAMTGATSLSNINYVAGNTLTIISSSTGNATVFLTFTV